MVAIWNPLLAEDIVSGDESESSNDSDGDAQMPIAQRVQSLEVCRQLSKHATVGEQMKGSVCSREARLARWSKSLVISEDDR